MRNVQLPFQEGVIVCEEWTACRSCGVATSDWAPKRCNSKLTHEPNHRMFVIKREKREKRRTHVSDSPSREELKENKFYVGAKSVFARKWGHKDLSAAVGHATWLVEKNGEDQFIVQIIRVVRRQTPPVVVETVK